MAPDFLDLTEETRAVLDRIADDVFDNPIDAAQLQQFIDDPNHLMRLAVADGQVVGMASGNVLFHPDKKPQLFINEVGVADAYRRKGIGQQLVGHLVAEAKKRGCDYAWLGTETDNRPAQACFRAVGGVSEAGEFILFEWPLAE